MRTPFADVRIGLGKSGINQTALLGRVVAICVGKAGTVNHGLRREDNLAAQLTLDPLGLSDNVWLRLIEQLQ